MSTRNNILEQLNEAKKFTAKKASDYKYHIYVDDGNGWELCAWFDDEKQANKEANFLKSKHDKVELRKNK